MKRIFVFLALLFGMLAAFGPMQEVMAQHANMDMAGCKNECHTCAAVCEKTISICQKHGGKHIDAKHINAIKDCIATCKLSGDLIDRGSSLQVKACNLCEQACNKCAESCDTFKDDKDMKACGDECRKCAASCHKMAG